MEIDSEQRISDLCDTPDPNRDSARFFGSLRFDQINGECKDQDESLEGTRNSSLIHLPRANYICKSSAVYICQS